VIAANGILILIPSALLLATRRKLLLEIAEGVTYVSGERVKPSQSTAGKRPATWRP
jgi:hypothetical protein